MVWLPGGYGDDRDRRYPLIYFVHSSGDEDHDSTFVAAPQSWPESAVSSSAR